MPKIKTTTTVDENIAQLGDEPAPIPDNEQIIASETPLSEAKPGAEQVTARVAPPKETKPTQILHLTEQTRKRQIKSTKM